VGNVLAAITSVVSFAFSYGEGAMRMSLLWASVISVAAAVSVWLTGRRPGWALVAVTVLTIALPLVQSTFSALSIVIVFVVFRVTVLSTIPAWLLGGLTFALLELTDVWQRVRLGSSFAEPSILYPALLAALAVGLGMQNRRLVRQHQQLLELRNAERDRAVAEERRRIARDIHDVAAHHLTALIVRNKIAEKVGSKQQLGAAASFTAHTAEEALKSLRHVVHLLSADDGAPLAPRPQLRDLPDIVTRMSEAGLIVRHSPLDLSDLPVPVVEVIIRLAQESLANILKHRGPGECWLTLDRTPMLVTLSVEDDGLMSDELPSPTAAVILGRGLAGMVERVETLGGRITLGRSVRGGFLVSAQIPVEP
jgi:signal transduction histidine kinase